jgi:hypothetical protein
MNRSRWSTTIVCISGLARSWRSLGRRPVKPVQAGTDLGYGFHNAHALVVSVNDEAASWASKSFLCCDEETRA